MLWEQQIEYASHSDVGMRRQNNQDSCAIVMESERDNWIRNGHIFIVADGMGGHAVGDLASKIAVDTLPLTYRKQRNMPIREALREATEVANAAIYERGSLNREFERMGTTCSTLVLGPEGAVISHVGDSRIYRVRGGQIDQLTFDHSLQWELMRRGQGTPEDIMLHQPRHVITRSMGPEPNVEVDLEGPYPVLPGDVFVLCSDGLTGHLSDSEIGAVAQELAPKEACRFLVNLANLRGGSDNITAVVIRVGKIPPGVAWEPPPAPVEPGDELGPLGLGLAWCVAAFFCLGVVLALLGHPVGGSVIAGMAVAAAGILLYLWRRQHPPQPAPEVGHSTSLWRAYQSASAKLTHKLLLDLIAPQGNLLQAADEEGWQYDRAEYAQACEQAEAAAAERKFGAALRHYARAINALTTGLYRTMRKSGDSRDSKVFRMPPAGK